jgi:hypothetical protein
VDNLWITSYYQKRRKPLSIKDLVDSAPTAPARAYSDITVRIDTPLAVSKTGVLEQAVPLWPPLTA